MQVGEEREITIEDFFALVETDGGCYEVDTPAGWVEIGDMKRELKECYLLKMASGISLGCGDDHLVETQRGWERADEIDVQDTIVKTRNGDDPIASREYLGRCLTFDFTVLHPDHKYYANGVVSHNCGKTSLVRAISEEMGYCLFEREAAVFGDRYQFADWLISSVNGGRRLGRRVVIFIDEIHQLKVKVQEALYYPMLEHRVDTAKGFVDLGSDFCIIAATTEKSSLTRPLISRFQPEIWDIGRYDVPWLSIIASRYFQSSGYDFEMGAPIQIASRCLGIPRKCTQLCELALDIVRSVGGDQVTLSDVEKVFLIQQLDGHGFDPIIRRYIEVLGHGPCKIGVLSAKVEQPEALVKGEIEPILLALGYLSIGGGGTRSLTDTGRELFQK